MGLQSCVHVGRETDGRFAAWQTSSNKEVKAFAEMMVRDHGGVNKAAVELVTRLKVTPEDNPTSQSLKAGGGKNIANLKKLKGAAFDKVYIDYEVVYHTQVLDALDKRWSPARRTKN